MSKTSVCLLIVAATAALAETSMAQCNRGRSRSTRSISGRFQPITPYGYNRPSASNLPLQASANAMYLANYRAQLARQRYLQTQQVSLQSVPQQMPNEGSNAVHSIAANDPTNTTSNNSVDDDRPTNERRERFRHQNAKKALAAAQRAESMGNRATALKYYRRVVRVVGESDSLGSSAATAIVRLGSQSPQSQRNESPLTLQANN